MAHVYQRVLITGGAGFIGSHLVEKIVNQPELKQLIILDSLVTGQKENIQTFLSDDRVTLLEHDATDLPWLTAFLQDTEAEPFTLILHFASPASPPRYQAYPVMTYQVNAFTTHVLAEYASQHETRLLFASTSEVYGDPLISPQSESYWGNVNPNGLRSCYDEGKRLGETVCGVWHRQTGADIRLVRIFNTYGPRMDITDGRVIPSFFQCLLNQEPLSIYGTGEQTRSFCYVDDLVRGILSYVEHPDLSGETINLGNPDEYTMRELTKVFETLVGRELERSYSPLPVDDPTQRRPDITKAKRLLQWEPTVPLAEGLTQTMAYFQEHHV